MKQGRRVFIERLAGAAAAGNARMAAAQPVPERGLGGAEHGLAEALRGLNEAARLGIAPEELARAEAYATGALLEAARKLRPLVLEDALEPPLAFDPKGQR
jgi:hypothetical protein